MVAREYQCSIVVLDFLQIRNTLKNDKQSGNLPEEFDFPSSRLNISVESRRGVICGTHCLLPPINFLMIHQFLYRILHSMSTFLLMSAHIKRKCSYDQLFD